MRYRLYGVYTYKHPHSGAWLEKVDYERTTDVDGASDSAILSASFIYPSPEMAARITIERKEDRTINVCKDGRRISMLRPA